MTILKVLKWTVKRIIFTGQTIWDCITIIGCWSCKEAGYPNQRNEGEKVREGKVGRVREGEIDNTQRSVKSEKKERKDTKQVKQRPKDH